MSDRLSLRLLANSLNELSVVLLYPNVGCLAFNSFIGKNAELTNPAQQCRRLNAEQ